MTKYNIEVTEHAIQRYRERTGAKFSDHKVCLRLNHLVETGEKVNPVGIHSVMRLLANGCYDAEYFMNSSGNVAVVAGGRIVTFHRNEKKWFGKSECYKKRKYRLPTLNQEVFRKKLRNNF